jgi:hypothetical protein
MSQNGPCQMWLLWTPTTMQSKKVSYQLSYVHSIQSRAYNLEEYKMENMYLLAHRDMGGLESQAARGMPHISLLKLQTDFLKEKFLRSDFNRGPTKQVDRVPLPARKLEDYIAKKAIIGEGEVISTEYLHVNNPLRFSLELSSKYFTSSQDQSYNLPYQDVHWKERLHHPDREAARCYERQVYFVWTKPSKASVLRLPQIADFIRRL